MAFRRENETLLNATQQTQDVIKNLLWRDCGLFVGGLIATMVGAKLLVDGAVTLAQNFGISETIIGLTIVAIGTSLPEMVASVIAAVRKHADLAYGNIIGSNIYNIFGILGITAMIKPIDIPQQIIDMDIWIMCAVTLLLVVMSRWGWVLNRWKGITLLLCYALYSIYLVSIA